MNSAQELVATAMIAMPSMLILGFIAAVFLKWALRMNGNSVISYWQAYRVATFGGMAVIL